MPEAPVSPYSWAHETPARRSLRGLRRRRVRGARACRHRLRARGRRRGQHRRRPPSRPTARRAVVNRSTSALSPRSRCSTPRHPHRRHRPTRRSRRGHRQRPDQRQGLRERGRLRRRRADGLQRRPGRAGSRSASPKSFAPGDKNFDFDLNQVSITPKRAEAVDFSEGYYDVAQAIIVLNDSEFADALAGRPEGRQDRRSDRHHLADCGRGRHRRRPPRWPSSTTRTPPSRPSSTARSTRSSPTSTPRSTSLPSRSRRVDHRRPVPDGERPRAVRTALREGQPAGHLRQHRRSRR